MARGSLDGLSEGDVLRTMLREEHEARQAAAARLEAALRELYLWRVLAVSAVEQRCEGRWEVTDAQASAYDLDAEDGEVLAHLHYAAAHKGEDGEEVDGKVILDVRRRGPAKDKP